MDPITVTVQGTTLRDLDNINVVLGKNGCGKSHLLKAVEANLRAGHGYGQVRYISPERGGLLQYQANIEQNITDSADWMPNERRKNQAGAFRQQSTALFRQLELGVLRALEQKRNDPAYVHKNFDDIVTALNELLDRVKIVRHDSRAFSIVDKDTGADTSPEAISSGEAELISLGIEVLAFAHGASDGQQHILLMDEPDVHLHPDLQDRLAKFIVKALAGKPTILIMATHSTALLAGLAEGADTRVAFMRRGDTDLRFRPVSDVDKAILPMFGAHPLSNVFNNAPPLLIEGEDDERIWQQAIRSARGDLKVFPCAIEGIDRFAEYEREVNNVIGAVYDTARAYSLRDRDLHPEAIDDEGTVVRMRLACRAAENLMLTDDVLAKAGTDWATMQAKIAAWAAANPSHQYNADVGAFINGGFDRMGFDLKTIRNILVGLISNKPWEVLVGQTIADLTRGRGADPVGSLRHALGAKLCATLLS